MAQGVGHLSRTSNGALGVRGRICLHMHSKLPCYGKNRFQIGELNSLIQLQLSENDSRTALSSFQDK